MSAAATTRLLAGAPTDRSMSLDEHLDLYGPASTEDPRALIETVEQSGLRGRGGADFPTATKLRAVATAQRLPVVVANGVEGEPLSAKDKVLLAAVPHLVIDGAVLAAQAVGAEDVLLCVADDAREVGAAVDAALSERDRGSPDQVRVRLERVPNRYLTGEESALVHLINGGPAKPTFIPPRPFERGVRGRPTLVQNVETLAHVAQIARWGADWFRELGTGLDPGSALVTISGAVRFPGVYEIECEATLRDIVALAGGPAEPLEAFLIGGYFGSWFEAERAMSLRLGHSHMREAGGSLGSGVIAALPKTVCGLAESARVVDYMARESSGQCGPCVHGLRAMADAMDAMVRGRRARDAHANVVRWAGDVVGRGACHHPDGAVRFAVSALSVFADEVARHEQHGACSATRGPPVLAVP